MVDAELWRRTLGVLEATTTRGTFDRWLRGSQLLDDNGDTWTVQVRGRDGLDWLNGRFAPSVARAASGVAGREVTVRFVVQGQGAPEVVEAPILEAVTERHVSVAGDGSAFVWDDYYIKLKLAFRKRALRELRGAPLSVFLCLALHVDADGIAHPGIKRICDETGYCRRAVIDALAYLDEQVHVLERLPSDNRAVSRYRVQGYAWFGNSPAVNVLEGSTSASS